LIFDWRKIVASVMQKKHVDGFFTFGIDLMVCVIRALKYRPT